MVLFTVIALIIIGLAAPDLFDQIIDKLGQIAKAVTPSVVLIR